MGLGSEADERKRKAVQRGACIAIRLIDEAEEAIADVPMLAVAQINLRLARSRLEIAVADLDREGE